MLWKMMVTKMMMVMKSSDDYGDEGDDHNYACIERLRVLNNYILV